MNEHEHLKRLLEHEQEILNSPDGALPDECLEHTRDWIHTIARRNDNVGKKK